MTLDKKNVPLGTLAPPGWLKPIGAGGRAILDILFKQGSAVQADLTRQLGLSQPSVARLVNGFVAEGMIRTTARAPSGRGNPSVALSLVSDWAFGLGVGMDGDALSLALLDFAGQVRATRRVSMQDRSRAAFRDHLIALRADLIAAAGIDPDRIIGTGVGFTGFFVDGPLRFNPPAILRDWVDADLVEVLSPALGSNLLCDRVATTAAIAESFLGVGRDCDSFAYCHLNNGFGGSLIANGKPMRGFLGNAGDFGGVWWMLDQGYPNLERLRIHIADAGSASATVEDMLERLTPETPGIEAWLAEAERPFASLAFLLGHIVAPEKVVIAGRLPIWLAERLVGRIKLRASPPRNDQPFRLPEVVASQVADDGGAIGAALMPMQALLFA